MRRILTILAAVLMVGTFAFAQTAPAAKQAEPKAKAAKKAPAPMKATGAIVSADASMLTIKAKAGEEKFALTADTKVKLDAKDATAADLKAGQTATVTYTKAGDTMTATQVVAKTKAAPKPKTEKTKK